MPVSESRARAEAINAILDERDALRAEVESLRPLRERAEEVRPMVVDTRELRAVEEAVAFILGEAAPSPAPEGDLRQCYEEMAAPDPPPDPFRPCNAEHVLDNRQRVMCDLRQGHDGPHKVRRAGYDVKWGRATSTEDADE